MNFLAHIFLSCHDQELLLGNFLADFLRKSETDALPAALQPGVALHRMIDQYTDQHPLVLQGVRRMYPEHGKYASVVVDIFYDFFLYQNWESYTTESFPDFRRRVYGILSDQEPNIPVRLRRQIRNMVASDWLQVYTHRPGIEDTFRRIRRRVSRPEFLMNPLQSLEIHRKDLNEEFNEFFPDLVREVDSFCG